MAKAERKFFQAECKKCQKTQKMKLVGKNKELQIIWLRCGSCHSVSSFPSHQIREHGEVISDSELEKRQKAQVRKEEIMTYAPEKDFPVGQKIYHAIFDDIGEVVEKAKFDGTMGKILVKFGEVGEKLLVENYQHE